jgi:hypothetical protein
VSQPDRDALTQILHAAREASKTFTASGNLALIEQICETQLGLPYQPDAPVSDDGQIIHG